MIDLVKALRDEADSLNKPPSLAELLNLLDYLERQQRNPSGETLDFDRGLRQLEEAYLIETVTSTLLKTSDDQERGAELTKRWFSKDGD